MEKARSEPERIPSLSQPKKCGIVRLPNISKPLSAISFSIGRWDCLFWCNNIPALPFFIFSYSKILSQTECWGFLSQIKDDLIWEKWQRLKPRLSAYKFPALLVLRWKGSTSLSSPQSISAFFSDGLRSLTFSLLFERTVLFLLNSALNTYTVWFWFSFW